MSKEYRKRLFALMDEIDDLAKMGIRLEKEEVTGEVEIPQDRSTFKILSTYAPALNEKGMTLATTFEDEPYNYPDGSPVNNASRSYNGTTTIRRAIN